MKKIILASKSLNRKQALEGLGLNFKVQPSNFDESSINDPDPKKLVLKLSEAKAKVVGEIDDDAIIIAGDLFVVYKNKIYGKPKTETEAFEFLSSFSGECLEIMAGLAVYRKKENKLLSGIDICQVKFRKLSVSEIKDYIKHYPVLDFAAAFDGNGLFKFAESVEGSYDFKAPFSLERLKNYLRELGEEL